MGRGTRDKPATIAASVIGGSPAGTGAALRGANRTPGGPSGAPQQTPDQLNHLLRPAEGQPAPLPEAQMFSDAHEEFHFGGLRVVADPGHEYIRDAHNPDRDRRFRGLIIDERSGETVGYLQRQLHHDREGRLVSTDGRVRITDAAHRVGGFGRGLMQHCQDRYRSWGVDLMEISAVDLGAYIWARHGFLFDPRRASIGHVSAAHELAREIDTETQDITAARRGALHAAQLLAEVKRSRVDELVYDGLVKADEARAFTRSFATLGDLNGDRWRRRIQTPAQIADYGRDRPFTGPDGEQTWLGKHFLVGPQDLVDDPAAASLGWSGVLALSQR